MAGVRKKSCRPAGPSSALTLATTGGTVVTGIVYEPDGTTPVQNAIVTARHNTTGDIIGKATTDALGAYSLVIE